MSSRRALLINKRNLDINTIIGGMSVALPTREALASRLEVSERQIRNFQIVGNDIHCTMMQLYQIPYYAFQNDTNITDYIDLNNKVRIVGNGAFLNSSLINFYAPNTIIENNGLSCNFTNVDFGDEYLNFRENPFSSLSALRNSRFKKLNAPNIVMLNNNSVRDNTELLEIYAPNLKNIGGDVFYDCVLLNSITSENIESISSRAFVNTAFTHLSFPKLTLVMGVNPFSTIQSLVTFSATKIESIGEVSVGNFFRRWESIELIDMRMLKEFGLPYEEYINAFTSTKSGFTWKVNIAMATNNSGGVDASLLYAKNNRSAIVEFYDDNGNYISTL